MLVLKPVKTVQGAVPSDLARFIAQAGGKVADCRIAIRYDKLATNFLGAIDLVAAVTWWV